MASNRLARFQQATRLDPNEGLPRYRSERSSKMDNIFDWLLDKVRCLITAPPQSGKSALAQLFVEYIKETNKTAVKQDDAILIYFITFKDYEHDPDRSDAEENKYMEGYIQNITGMNRSDFKNNVVNNNKQKCIVVTDESQMIYQVRSFWTQFKAGSTCYLLSFAAFSVDDKRACYKGSGALATTPVEFVDKKSYAFVAFSREEFNEVAFQFQNVVPSRVSTEVIDFVAEQVESSHQANQANYYSIGNEKKDDTKLYHPGLTYACFYRFATNSEQENEVETLYMDLYEGQRCFASFTDFRCLFIRQVLREHSAPSNEQIQKKCKSFDIMFSYLIALLLCGKPVEYDERDTSELTIVKIILVRYGFSCVTRLWITNMPMNVIHLSCPLVRMHVNLEVFKMEWSREMPKPYYQISSLEDYAISVISYFDRESLLYNYQRAKDDNKLRKYAFKFEFQAVAKRDTTAIISPEYYFYHKDGGTKGKVDFRLNGRYNKGIELCCAWSEIAEHVGRIRDKYSSLDDYLTVHFEEGKMKSKKEIENLIDNLKQLSDDDNEDQDKYLRMLLVANIVPNEGGEVDFTKVAFYRPNGETRSLDKFAEATLITKTPDYNLNFDS